MNHKPLKYISWDIRELNYHPPSSKENKIKDTNQDNYQEDKYRERMPQAKERVYKNPQEHTADKKIASSLDLNIGQLVLVKNQHEGLLDPTYIYDHWVAKVLNDSTVLPTTKDGKEKKCNIHHVKPV